MENFTEIEKFILGCADKNFATINQVINETNVNLKNKEGSTLLMLASCCGRAKIVKELIKIGADVSLQDNDGSTALMWAFNSKDIIVCLHENGGNINAVDNKNETALMRASHYGAINAVNILLKLGAKLDLTNNDNQTAYEIAINQNQIEVMYSFNPKMIDEEHVYRILAIACEDENEQEILFIFDKGADFYKIIRQGESALDILMSHDELSLKLQSLIEKLLLAQETDINNSIGISL